MKIIFDSEEQKKEFMTHLITEACPHFFGIKHTTDCRTAKCEQCWGNAIEVEVRHES